VSEVVLGVSDEPTRLNEIVVPVFSDEMAGWTSSLTSGASASLVAGVLAQDDCAIFELHGDQDLVLGSDYVRGSKFRLYELGYINNFDVGYYLAMANFSDIAAMGALPLALLSVIRYPKSMPDEEFRAVVAGIRLACAKVGARNVGGDIGTAERLILSASAVGSVESGRALRRSGAKTGDILCLTGHTGIAGAAQQYFYRVAERGHELGEEREALLLESWQRPCALVDQGRLLCTSGIVSSCQDTSDGLKAAVESIANASAVGFVIYEDELPVADVVRDVSRLRALTVLEVVFGDSVDFQLVFTVAPDDLPTIRSGFRASGLDFFAIGVATSNREVVLRGKDGGTDALPGQAWRHAI